MKRGPSRELLAALAIAVALAVVALVSLPALAALVVSLPLVLGVFVEERRARALVDLELARTYGLHAIIDRGRPVLGAAARGLTPAGHALIARVDQAAERLEREADAVDDAASTEARAQTVRARFTAAMGHELKTPLASIVGFSTVLERRPPTELTSAQRESATMIRRGAQELAGLLTDLLDSAKLDVGRIELERTFVPTVELLTQAVTEACALVEGRAVRIEATFQPGLSPIRVDRARLVQAIVAVVRHAARGLDEGKLLLDARRARCERGAAELQISVRDPQRTIAPDELEHVFEAFRPTRSAGTGRKGGLGLALSVARRLVRLHGGEITAGIDEGGGTRLVVSLPMPD